MCRDRDLGWSSILPRQWGPVRHSCLAPIAGDVWSGASVSEQSVGRGKILHQRSEIAVSGLVSISELALHIGEADIGDSGQLMHELLEAAREAIERQLAGRSLEENQSYTERHTAVRVDGHDCVYVNNAPITSVTQLVDDVRGAARVIDPSEYITDAVDNGENFRQGKIELYDEAGRLTAGRLNVEVEYYGGWSAATIPLDLKRAWIDLVAFWYNNQDRVGITEFSDGSYRVTWDKGYIPPELEQVFSAYRIGQVC